MSRETDEWLNNNVLIGNTDERGHAWHYRASAQGEEPNHYPGPIPVADVQRRLFHWHAVPRRVAVEVPADVDTMTHFSDDGQPMRWDVQEDRQAMARSDNHYTMGLFKSGYTAHQYDDWLIGVQSNVLGDTLEVSSAGLLKAGAVAWVEASVHETLHDDRSGFDFRPNLLASTSFDGSLATTFARTVTATVCDNTLAAALSETAQKVKVKHSRYSGLKLDDARQALSIVEATADDFTAELHKLIETEVSSREWERFLDALTPVTNEHGEQLKGRAYTLASKKRDELNRMYRHDERAATWHGTALGVLQAVNTWEHHESTVRGASRADRNALRTIQGDFDKVQQETYQTLTRVLVDA